jgi:hypothetical protein
MKKITLLLVFLLPGIILAAGCTGTVSPGSAPTESTIPTSPAATIGVTAIPSTGPASSGAGLPGYPPSETATTIPTTRIASDNPHLEYFNVTKKTFADPLPNCLMANAFPAVAADPLYGIKQVVPKLTAISDDDYQAFLRKYTEGKAENTPLKSLPACQGSAAEPTWNFIEIRVVLDPTNFQPSNYTITEEVRSNGKIIAQFPTDQKLVINQQFAMTSYVPIRTSELDLFDNVGLTYTRH